MRQEQTTHALASGTKSVLFLISIEEHTTDTTELIKDLDTGYSGIIHETITIGPAADGSPAVANAAINSLRAAINKETGKNEKETAVYTLMVYSTIREIPEAITLLVREFVREIGSNQKHKIDRFLFSKIIWDHSGIIPREVLYRYDKDRDADTGKFVTMKRRPRVVKDKKIFIALEVESNADETSDGTKVLSRKVEDRILDVVDFAWPDYKDGRASAVSIALMDSNGIFRDYDRYLHALEEYSDSDDAPYVIMAMAVNSTNANVRSMLRSYISLIDHSVEDRSHKSDMLIAVVDIAGNDSYRVDSDLQALASHQVGLVKLYEFDSLKKFLIDDVPQVYVLSDREANDQALQSELQKHGPLTELAPSVHKVYSDIPIITRPKRELLVTKQDATLKSHNGVLFFSRVVLLPQIRQGRLFGNYGDFYDGLRKNMITNGGYVQMNDKNESPGVGVYELRKVVIYKLTQPNSAEAPLSDDLIKRIIHILRPHTTKLEKSIISKNHAEDDLTSCHFAVLYRDYISALEAGIKWMANKNRNLAERIVMCCKDTADDEKEASEALRKKWSVGGITYKPVSDVMKVGGIMCCLFALITTKTKFGAFV